MGNLRASAERIGGTDGDAKGEQGEVEDGNAGGIRGDDEGDIVLREANDCAKVES